MLETLIVLFCLIVGEACYRAWRDYPRDDSQWRAWVYEVRRIWRESERN